MTGHPIFTVIVPTIGRPHLLDTLRSLADQRLAKYIQVLVVADTHNRVVKEPKIKWAADSFGDYQWLEHDAGHSAWGHPQRNWAMEKANGLWVATLDDDDVWTPEAMDQIIGGVSAAKTDFHIFRMRHAQSGVVIWNRRFPTQGNVGTPMMVWKNGSPVGRWGDAYEGDFNFVVNTIHVLPNGQDDIYWHESIIATIRPGVPA